MKKSLYLLLRDISISQGHMANIHNDELIIYFFQEPSLDINDSFRIHTKVSKLDITIRFSFNERRFNISELGETKLTSLFNEFKNQANYTGVFKIPDRYGDDDYKFKFGFLDFLKKEKKSFEKEEFDAFSNALSFDHHILQEDDYIVEDLTNTLHFLEKSAGCVIRRLPSDKLGFIQKYNDEQSLTFDNLKELAVFLNKCFDDAAKVRKKWEDILETTFSHTFRVEGSSLVFNQWYYSSNVNELFYKFTDSVAEAKERFLRIGQDYKQSFESFLFEHPQINPSSYISEVKLVPNKDLISFQLLHYNFSLLNKNYALKLTVEPMMNGLVLEVGRTSKVFNLCDSNNCEQIFEEIQVEIGTFFSRVKAEFLDALEVLNTGQKYSILDGDLSFVSLVGVDRYRFNRIPPTLSSISLIYGEPSFTIRSFTKTEFLTQLRTFVKLDNLISEQLPSIISHFNYVRKYDKYQVFFAFKREKLFIATPVGNFEAVFKVNNDSSIKIVLLNKNLSYPIHTFAFFETVLKAIEDIEKHILLAYVFDSESQSSSDELSQIFSRYTVDTSGLFENHTKYDVSDLTKEIAKIITINRFKPLNCPSMFEFGNFKEERIKEFVELLNSHNLLIEYLPLTGAFHIH
ncbi:hypothetical protein [Priestia megaterium]|uniref:Uncharacterized protein n=1 Tax=Priestia megaterium TaxID=1404 RepID=A0A6M6E100_PRIMG|nr:hypothetical protein [Priestia megaterium]QJX80723.1 hypothetical protein FDZ14_32040 [Priestia megaterium]